MAEQVDILIRLREVAKFVSDAYKASKAMGQVGDTSEEAGKKAGIGWKGVAKWAASAGVVYGAQKFIRGAVSATTDLAKSTLALQRTTNLDTQTASEWAALTKERGISTKQFQMGLKTLSVQMEKSRTGTADQAAKIAGLRKQIDLVAAAGGKKAPAELAKLSRAISQSQGQSEKARKTLAALGVSQAEIAKGDTANVLYDVADSFKNMDNAAQRTTAAQKLFGRSGIALLPILMKGRAGVKELLDQQKEAGNYISGKGVSDTKKLVEQQRELNRRYQGVKVQLGTALLPVMVQFGKLAVALARALQPLTKNALLFKVAVMALVAAFVAYKVAMIAATIATTVFETAASPVVLVVLAVVAGVAALIAIGWLLYKNWGTISAYAGKAWAAVQAAMSSVVGAFRAAFDWVKANWPLLLGILAGPFGIAAALIVKHFGTIKRVALDVVDAIKRAFQNLIAFVKSIPSQIGGVAKSIVKKIPGGGWLAGHLATGGVAHVTGQYLVGERGAEVVTLPRGASVQPVAAPTVASDGGHYGAPIEISIPVVLDGREIARSTARVTADKLARR